MVGEMIAGVNSPVVLALKDCYGNVIDGSSLRGAAPLTINVGNFNYSVQSVGRIFQLVPGLTQTVAKSGIIITANYGSVQLASYNATCLPGKILIECNIVSITKKINCLINKWIPMTILLVNKYFIESIVLPYSLLLRVSVVQHLTSFMSQVREFPKKLLSHVFRA